jgi:lipoic acid synthetase
MDRPGQPRKQPARLPQWLRKNRDRSALHGLKAKLRNAGLSSVCEEARCPNISECFHRPTATFLILGDACTRGCLFCSVTKGHPAPVDHDEPSRLAQAAQDLGLRHVVVTSVTRDDLPDRGASHFAACIRTLREHLPACTVEILTPDFSGGKDHVQTVLKEKPDVFGHNVETVPRLYKEIRPGASLRRSLDLLSTVKGLSPDTVVKSGFMVGLGETLQEIEGLIASLREAGCDVVTIGQYLRPSMAQMDVVRYWEPEYYQDWSNLAESLGIGYCIAGPFVRSSYRAKEVLEEIRAPGHQRKRCD